MVISMRDDPGRWTVIEKHDFGDTQKLAVPGGWLYRAREWNLEDVPAVALVFVPGLPGRKLL